MLGTGRMDNSTRLGTVPGVVTPRIVSACRERRLTRPTVRPLSPATISRSPAVAAAGVSHGQQFVCVESADGLASAASQLSGDDLLVIEYLNAHGPDGKARKYRVMTIGGKLYPLHLAISDHWKVHYFSAEMAGNAASGRRGRFPQRHARSVRAAGDGLAGTY